MPEDRIHRIVKETAPLSEEYLPEYFLARGNQEGELQACLGQVLQKQRPVPVWLHGPPGTGKSSLARNVLNQLEEQGVRTAYVNCWSNQTFFAVLEAVFQELRAVVGDQRDVAFKFERLRRISRERPLVIALDEVDQLFLKERNATLYNLSQLASAGLVCLSQSREAYLSLDARVHSRLQPRFLGFTPYSTDELVHILEKRALQSLEPDTWCRADLERIASASQGDARIGIQTLRIAVYQAEKGRVPQIRVKDIKHGLEKSSALRRAYLLKTLSEHHRLLYRIVKARPGITTVGARKRYKAEATANDLGLMANRTFNHYKNYLIAVGLLRERQDRGRGNVRRLWAIE